MQDSTFLVKKLREKFLSQKTNDFNLSLPQNILDIEDKKRSNIFTWRGQFSPQLIENLLMYYCPRNAVILDPFAGSGTVLYESGCFGLKAFGCELNPAAWILIRTYEFINIKLGERQLILDLVQKKLEKYFPRPMLFDISSSQEIDILEFDQAISNIHGMSRYYEKIILDTLVILLDLANNSLTIERIYNIFISLCQIIRNLPYSESRIITSLCDARSLPIEANSIDFVITSPPYINVFNYHQNYRRSAEVLGWDLLKIAKSEIGSNRANRGNRFLTVTQYCMDIAFVLKEIQRVCKPNSRIIFVVGYESNVLKVPFYNSEIISEISIKSGVFDLVLNQKRNFKNKFGKVIREDLLHLVNRDFDLPASTWDKLARDIAYKVLNNALSAVADKNRYALLEAIKKIYDLDKSPIYRNQSDSFSQTFSTLSCSESTTMIQLPTPHYDKLVACLNNPRLPMADRDRVEEAVNKYRQWIQELESVERGQPDTVEKLVGTTNRYKRFIELDLIFDSSDNFLYRQKGQLKLDNTILEEFLPQLIYRSLRSIDDSFEIGPKSTFSGLSFLSSLGNPGQGGEPTLRTKNQDFVLGKKLYLKTAFDRQFTNFKLVESHLGYICAECKTNLDKTMFQEAVATSRDLKIAVPSSLYFLVCEFLDMTPVSITSTQIDDVLIVRKCRRMSANIRQEYKTPESRRQYRQEYADFIDASKYYPDVFQRMIDKIQTLVDDTAPGVEQVLERGHF
jgi:DNA modification methylase